MTLSPKKILRFLSIVSIYLIVSTCSSGDDMADYSSQYEVTGPQTSTTNTSPTTTNTTPTTTNTTPTTEPATTNVSTSDFNSETNMVLLRIYMYESDGSGGENEIIITEEVPVFDIEGSTHKFYTNMGATQLIQLDEDGNVIYGEDERDSYFQTTHFEVPAKLDFQVTSNVEVNMEVYYSNAQDPDNPDKPTEVYEYIWDFGDNGKIDGKSIVAWRTTEYEQYTTPFALFPVKFGGKYRSTSNFPMSEIVYKQLLSMEYENVEFRYESDLYTSEQDVLDNIKVNFDQSLSDMAGTNGPNNLSVVNLFGGREYFCGAEAFCVGNDGFINIFVKTPDLYIFSHEIGHTWSLREDSPVNWTEWEDMQVNNFVSDYGLTNVYEYFADAFFLYFSGQLELEDFPDIYKLPDSVKEKLDSYFQ